MRPSAKKAFYFHADASSLGGFIGNPPQEGSSFPGIASLSPRSAVTASRGQKPLIVTRLSPAGRRTLASLAGRSKRMVHGSTLVTSVVEGLNILETVKAERMVAQISIEHPVDGGNPTISLAGSHFDGFRLGGCDVSPTLNPKLLGVGSVDRIEWPIFSTDWPRASCQNGTNGQSGTEECPVGY